MAVAVVSGPALDDYIEVNERLAAFYAKYPNGSLQSEWELKTVGDALFIVVTAYAYRDPYDARPGMGTAWELYPGRTPFTKGSELMVGETSAWGRAIASLGFKVKRSVASAEEVRAAEARRAGGNGNAPTIDAERVRRILAAFHEAKLNYESIDMLLGSAGLDALRAKSAKAVTERIEGLSAEQADALEAELGG